MTPRRSLPPGLAMQPMPTPQLPAMQSMQMVPFDEDASGAQAIGGLANMASLLAGQMGGPKGQPTDAPQRRKIPFAAAMENANYA